MIEREDDGPPPIVSGEPLAPGYTVVRHLRRGEDLDVYDIWSDERRCRCIGKTPRPDRQTTRVRARLLREGRLLLNLAHPHLVRAYDVLTDPRPIMIQETLPGETLAHLIERQPGGLDSREVAQLGIHLCSALGYMHARDILHLDIKPSNIVASHGMAKVLDLSLVRAPGPYKGGTGTDGYMSPEQVEGGFHGPATDVWGLGATLYEAVTGEPACDFDDASEGTGDDISQEVCVPPPVHRARDIAPSLAVLIDQALGRDPAERPDVDTLRVELEAFLATG